LTQIFKSTFSAQKQTYFDVFFQKYFKQILMIEILEFFLKSRVKKTKFEIIVYYRQKKKGNYASL